MSNPKLIIEIIGKSEQYTKEMTKVQKSSNVAMKGLASAAKISATAMAALGTSFVLLVNEATKFNSTFSNVITLLDDTSFKTKTLTEGIDDLKKGVLAVASETGQSFETLNKSLFDLVSAGVAAEDAIDALRVSSNLAIAGATDTSTAVDGITSALNAYSMEADQAQAVAEKFFTAQKGGKTTIAELSNGFGKAGATASSFGVSLDELLASVAAVTTGGIKTSEAYTGLNAVFSNIVKPTADAAKEAERLGIQFDSAALRSKGLKGFLDSITESAGFNNQSLEKLFGSVEALKVAQALTGAQSDEFASILGQVGNKALTASNYTNALNEKMNTTELINQRAVASFKSIAVQIGDKLTPAYADVARSILGFIDEEEEQNKIAEEAVNVFKTFASVLDTLFSPALNVLKGIFSDLSGFINENSSAMETFVEWCKTAGEFLGWTFAGIIQVIADSFTWITDAIGETILAVAQFPDAVGNMVDKSLGFFDELAAGALRVFSGIVENFQSLVDILPGFSGTFQDTIDALNAKADEYEQTAKERDARIAEYEAEKREQKLALEDEQREEDLERQAEWREEDLEIKEEQNQEDLEKNQEQLDKLIEQERAAREAELKASKTANTGMTDAKKKRVKEEQKLDQTLQDSAVSALSAIVGDSKAAQVAIFLVQKGMAVARALAEAEESSLLAYASQLIPGDPTSIARAEAARLSALASGNLTAATIAATALPQIATTISAAEGGIVPGGFSNIDSVPALLAPGEIVVPSNLNPLNPNFEDTFGSSGGGSSVDVTIGIEEDAARYLTVKQRENSKLGIQE